jgi:type III pantothenate kinase
MPDRRLLAIDAGNTRVKWGVHEGAAWTAVGALPTAEAAGLHGLAARHGPFARVIVSNVAGEAVEQALRKALGASAIDFRVIRSGPSCCGVTNGYREPGQLGSDRWAALVAAHHAQDGHKLVVNVGTALTVDALAASGRFEGGLIVPGPALMRRSLGEGTARLRLTEGRFAPFPDSTPDAITSGAIQACAGAIERAARAMESRGLGPARVLLSGGAAGEIAPHLGMDYAIHENLVLDGLALMAHES